jgi:hypothetical protein
VIAMTNEQLREYHKVPEGSCAVSVLKAAPTPGPWEFVEAGRTEEEYNVARPLTIGEVAWPHNDIANVFSADDSTVSITREQAVANAALIARACNLVQAGHALQKAQEAKVIARGDLPPDLDWGLSENEQVAALMMNALMERNDILIAALEKIANMPPRLMPQQLVDMFIDMRLVARAAIDGANGGAL